MTNLKKNRKQGAINTFTKNTRVEPTCIALRGLGMPIKVASAIKDKAAIDVDNWNLTKFLML